MSSAYPSNCCVPLVFRVEAAVDPGLLARTLGLFAKLDMIPDRVIADRCGDRLDIEIRIATLEADRADHVAKVIAGLIPVLRVSLDPAG